MLRSSWCCLLGLRFSLRFEFCSSGGTWLDSVSVHVWVKVLSLVIVRDWYEQLFVYTWVAGSIVSR